MSKNNKKKPINFEVVWDESSGAFRLLGDGKVVVSYMDKSIEITSHSESFLEFMADDLLRIQNLRMLKSGIIRNSDFSAYALYTEQMQLLADDESIFIESCKKAPVYDQIFLDISAGPREAMEQMDRLVDVRAKLKKIIGPECYDYLSSCAEVRSYVDGHGGDKEDFEEAYVSDEDFVQSKCSRVILEKLLALSPTQKGALIGLWSYTQTKSLFLVYLLIAGQISVEAYARSACYLGSNFIDWLEDDRPDANHPLGHSDESPSQKLYEIYKNCASLVAEYIRHETNEESEDLKTINKGENKTIEFKQTFSWDVRNQTKAKHVTHSALKTIAGFLNTEGGTLYIGVDDSGVISGIDEEVNRLFKKNKDKFLLNFKDVILNKFGEQLFTTIQYEVKMLSDKEILKISVQSSKTAIFLDKEFYVRTNPATEKLEGRELVEYVRHHWPTE